MVIMSNRAKKKQSLRSSAVYRNQTSIKTPGVGQLSRPSQNFKNVIIFQNHE